MTKSSFQDWAKDGRLATIGLVVVFVAWLGFQIFVAPANRPPLLDQILYTMAGAWLGNIAFAQGKKEESVEHRVEKLEKKDGDDV